MKSETNIAPSNTCECHGYLRDAIEGFENDRADYRFQDGYLAALIDMRDGLDSDRRTRAARAAERAKALNDQLQGADLKHVAGAKPQQG